MPLYEYECRERGHVTEVIQRLSDPPLKSCPECGSPVRKLLSAPAFQFKGEGWYVTDYARKSDGGGAARSESKEKAAPATGSEKKSDAGQSAAE